MTTTHYTELAAVVILALFAVRHYRQSNTPAARLRRMRQATRRAQRALERVR